METFLEKLKKVKKEVNFDLARKEALKNVLTHRVEENLAVRIGKEQRRVITERSISSYFKPYFRLKTMPIVAALLVITLLGGGGTSLAAQNALPGDALYPVKISINEEVVLAFQFSDEAKANYEAKLAERRLEEASELAAQARLNSEARAQVESRFEAFAQRVQTRVQELNTKGKVADATDIASRFETSLRAHEQILARFGEEQGETGAEARSLGQSLRRTLNAVVQTRANLEAKMGANGDRPEVKVAAEGKIAAAENAISATHAYLEQRARQLGAEAVEEAQAQLQLAEGLVVQAKGKVEAGAYGEAFSLANEAIRVAQKARLLLKARTELNIDVRIGPLPLPALERQPDIEMPESNEEQETRPKPAENNGRDQENRTEVEVEDEIEVNVNQNNGNAQGSGGAETNIQFNY